MKACEKSEGCRDSATEVLVELEIFVEIGGRIPELESHRVLIPLIERMLELLEDVMTYIFLCTLAQASSGSSQSFLNVLRYSPGCRRYTRPRI